MVIFGVIERDQVFIGKTNGSSCRKSRPKLLIQSHSSARSIFGLIAKRIPKRPELLFVLYKTSFANISNGSMGVDIDIYFRRCIVCCLYPHCNSSIEHRSTRRKFC